MNVLPGLHVVSYYEYQESTRTATYKFERKLAGTSTRVASFVASGPPLRNYISRQRKLFRFRGSILPPTYENGSPKTFRKSLRCASYPIVNENLPRFSLIREKHSLSTKYLKILDSFWQVYCYVRLTRPVDRCYCLLSLMASNMNVVFSPDNDQMKTSFLPLHAPQKRRSMLVRWFVVFYMRNIVKMVVIVGFR